MPEEKRVVYLEDVQQTSSSNVVEEQPPPPADENTETKAAVSVPAKKRQLTLMDIMGTSSQGGAKNAKKARLPTTDNAAASLSPAVGPQKLNFIPFSLSSFQESLTEEQTRLLRLEMEVMGLSW
jgi:uracil-DNA glycosylase